MKTRITHRPHPKAAALIGAIMIALMMTSTFGCQNTPRPTETIRSNGDYEFQHGNYAAAAEHYQEIADRTPGDWRAQYRLGLSLLEIDRPGDAREAFEVAANLKPQNEEIGDALARAMYEQGATNELFAFLRQRADRSRATSDYMHIARYAMLTDDYDMAELALRTAIEVDGSQSVDPHLGMAALQTKLGNNLLAAEHLRRAEAINPDDRRVRQRLAEYDDRRRTLAEDG